MDLKPEDFEGIEKGDVIALNNWCLFLFTAVVGDTVYTQHGAIPLKDLHTLRVLTGKYQPWSLDFVPDWAATCTQSKATGKILFWDRDHDLTRFLEHEDCILTPRPKWCGKKGE